MENSVDSRFKHVKSKQARLRVKQKLLMSRKSHFGSPDFRRRLAQIQYETRLCRRLILRIKRSQRVDVLFNKNTSCNCLHVPLHGNVTSNLLPAVDEHPTEYWVAHDAINRRTRRKRFSERFIIANRDAKCCYCKAIMWKGEKVEKSSNMQPRFSLCCGSGQVNLELLPHTPDYLDSKMGDCMFKEQIRTYNSMLSFTSMGAHIDSSVTHGRGPYSFRISGEIYHRIGSLLPESGMQPKYAQLYIYDTDHEVSNRLSVMRGRGSNGIDASTLEGLQSLLNSINPYTKLFRYARDRIIQNPKQNFHIRLLHSRGRRQYNRPTASEIAALIDGDGIATGGNRDIIIHKTNGYLQRIDETHPSYMPLQYPLLFPYGTDGWRRGIPLATCGSNSREGVTMRQFYAFRMQSREEEGNTVLRGGRLFQQYVVDCYASIEQYRLRFIKANQSKLRADLYKGLSDAVMAGDVDASVVGRRFILPSSFTGGPRNMIQHYQDAMAICRVKGPPDLFITFTCNPNWIEIRNELARTIRQRSEDRPDLVARIFRLKLKQLQSDLTKKNVFGDVIADIQVIEFQKRGLPHSHILLTLSLPDKFATVEEIDDIISAELPDKETDPLLYETVLRTMIHGPCGPINPSSPCMVNGRCSKHYPKEFCTETTIDENGYVTYRRRNDGRVVNIKDYEINNRWVIPYNRDLTLRYDCHINVERCAHTKAIKYLYKYIHKGHDRATVVIEPNFGDSSKRHRPSLQRDEVKQYLDCRYVSAIESCWRIYDFDLQRHFPSVERLQYHLPNEQFVVFNDNEDIQTLLDHQDLKDTKFTKWFDANRMYPEARKLTYAEFPSRWVWNREQKKWTYRQKRPSIGRLTYAHPNSGERYFLRMLLNIVRGAKSYEDIRTVNGVLHPSFKDACLARGLLADDNEWNSALMEASTWASASQLRYMFCSMLLFSEVTNPKELYENHWKDLTDDFLYRMRSNTRVTDVQSHDNEQKDWGLLEIEHILNKNGRSLKEFPPMSLPSSQSDNFGTNRLITEELDYDTASVLQEFQTLHAGLNAEQRSVFSTIIEAHENKTGGLFFVYGSGGTGKTYLWKTIIARIRSKRRYVVSVASSGIAALLLPSGKTAHSRFKIPLDLNESSCCAINHRTDLASLIQQTSLFIWDEASMINRFAFEAVERTIRDLVKHTPFCSDNKIFGGKLFVLGGDFRQILPVVPKAGRELTVASSLPRSSIWGHCQVLNLRTNMRVLSSTLPPQMRLEYQNFASWIISVGEGNVPTTKIYEDNEANWIKIPKNFLIRNDKISLDRLIEAVYPTFSIHYKDWRYLQERCILAPKNDDVDDINSKMLSLIPGESQVFLSADTITPIENDDTIENMNPPELLHSLNFPGLPNHRLELKVGAPVILLRNLNQSLGLCNGTRMIVHKMGNRVIEARVISGSNDGEMVLIPRIVLSPSTSHNPFILKRRQFPIKLAFSMTINKSQGQTLKTAGLYLPNPVFSHGQLYVAISRVTSPTGLKILIVNKDEIPKDVTKNIVYKEIFNGIPH